MNFKNYIFYQLSKRPIKITKNENIVIMSFNIRCKSDNDKGDKYYKVRLPYIRKILEKENPDIIGFQEVKVCQFKYLLKILKNYNYEYKKRDIKKDGEATPIFFKKDRFNCLNKNTFWISRTYKIMSNTFNNKCFRTCSYVYLKDKISNKKIYVFNTHLDHINKFARVKGIKLIKTIAKKLTNNKIPNLIIGDMNDVYASPTIKELFSDYLDASNFKNRNKICTFHDYGNKREKIDYIALSKNIKEIDYKVITDKYKKIYPSDHYPIETIIKI